MNRKIAGLVISGVAATALTTGIAQVALAEPTPSPGTTATATPNSGADSTGRENRGPGKHGRMDSEMAKQLAEKLGIDEAKVTQAQAEIRNAHQAEAKTAFSTRLDQAVTDGKLTRAEADAVLKAAEAGVIPMGGRGPR